MTRTPPLIRLTTLAEADLPALFKWINDRDLVLANAPFKPVTEAQHRAWFTAIQERRDTVLLGIRLLESGALIGSCQLHSIDSVSRCAELQIRLGEARGHGYGTEAVRLLLQLGFKDLNLNRVYLRVFANNAPALHVYEKTGFVREGVLRQAVYVDGKYVDVIAMGILRSDHERGGEPG